MRILASLLLTLLFLLSLLNQFPPPTMELWKVSVLTREAGVFLAGIQILLTIFVLVRSLHGKLSLILLQILMCGLSLLLFLRPAYQAQEQSSQFSQALNQAFPNSKKTANISLNIWELFSLWPAPSITPETLVFTKEKEGALNLNFYKVQGTSLRPLIVMIHGGGWQAGDLKQLPQVNDRLVSMGYNVAAISYRFSPEFQWPAQQEDVFAALDFLFERAPFLGFDPNNVFILGRSAGGQLAGIAAYKYKNHPLRGVIILYAPTDMTWGYELSEESDMLESRKLLEELLGGGPFGNEKSYFDASPIFFLDQAIPTLLLHGKQDPLTFYRHSERLNNRLKSRKIPSAFLRLDGATHGFEFNPHGPSSQIFYQALDYFISSQIQNSL